MHSKMRVNQVSQKPIFLIISIKNRHSTLSYILLMFSFRAMKSAFFDLCVFMWCSNLEATKILFEIALFDWNALCDSKIRLGKTFLSLLARTLGTSLYIILQRAMDRNFETRDGLLILGMRVIKVRFMEERIEPEFKQFKTACETSSPMVNQNFWQKKQEVIHQVLVPLMVPFASMLLHLCLNKLNS